MIFIIIFSFVNVVDFSNHRRHTQIVGDTIYFTSTEDFFWYTVCFLMLMYLQWYFSLTNSLFNEDCFNETFCWNLTFDNINMKINLHIIKNISYITKFFFIFMNVRHSNGEVTVSIDICNYFHGLFELMKLFIYLFI